MWKPRQVNIDFTDNRAVPVRRRMETGPEQGVSAGMVAGTVGRRGRRGTFRAAPAVRTVTLETRGLL